MSPRPSGELRRSATGRDLILRRAFPSDIREVWAAVTEPDRTAQWFASWTGEPGPGSTIQFTMTFEDGASAQEMKIVSCEPPHHLEVVAVDEYGSWHLEVRLTGTESGTSLELTHHLDATANPGEVGPGWEYYLDNLVAAQQGRPLPSFDEYFPSQQPYYEALDRA